jgi:hypothetical protein
LRNDTFSEGNIKVQKQQKVQGKEKKIYTHKNRKEIEFVFHSPFPLFIALD